MCIMYGEKDKKGSCNYSCFEYIYLSCVLFLQNVFTAYKPMSVVTAFMIGN